MRPTSGRIATDPAGSRGTEGLYTGMGYVPGDEWAEETRGRQATYEALWRRNPWRERT